MNRLSIHRTLVGLAFAVGATGCKEVTADLPAGTSDPSLLNNAAGALEKRNTVYGVFGDAFFAYEKHTAVLSDEAEVSVSTYADESNYLDQRVLSEAIFGLGGSLVFDMGYKGLQSVRGRTAEAIGALAKYDTVHSPALRGEMYALQGYAEIMLAELYCSGVPLSTYNFENDFTYKPGSTQQQVYQDAIGKLDTAVALSDDSAHILNMARVGLGRAYLDLGDYAHAAAAVVAVPDDFHYEVSMLMGDAGHGISVVGTGVSLSDSEGINGLPFLASGDPRTRLTAGLPVKYRTALVAPYRSFMTLADGVEARLIQAEAALNANANNPQWLSILNALRSTYFADPNTIPTVIDTLGITHCGGDSFDVCGSSPGNDTTAGKPNNFPGPGYLLVSADTTPNSGLANACDNNSYYLPCAAGDTMVVLIYRHPPDLAPLADPAASLSGTAATNARLNLLFRERAYWMYLTGHRQGDLRRLVRNYHRDQSTVYPTGLYGLTKQYGSDVNVPIPNSESPNPYFHGCLDRKA